MAIMARLLAVSLTVQAWPAVRLCSRDFKKLISIHFYINAAAYTMTGFFSTTSGSTQ